MNSFSYTLEGILLRGKINHISRNQDSQTIQAGLAVDGLEDFVEVVGELDEEPELRSQICENQIIMIHDG